MINATKIIVFIMIILFFQVGVLPHLAIFETYPNIIFIVLISLTIITGFKKSIVWIVAAGLFFESYSISGVIGIFVASLLFCCYLSFFLSQGIFKKDNPASIVPIFAIVFTSYNLLIPGIQALVGLGTEFKPLLLIINLIYNLIFAIPIFYFIKKYAGKTDKI